MDIIDLNGKGYIPVKDFNNWRIAQLNYEKETNDINYIKLIERHLETDEVFILLEGEAFLFTAGCNNEIDKIAQVEMEKNKLYNIKKELWHTAVLKPNAKLIIVENADTRTDNSEYHYIDEKDRKFLKELIP